MSTPVAITQHHVVILPGNRIILFADLAVIPFVVCMAAPLVNGNVLRLVIMGTITLILGFYLAMVLAPLFTSAASASGFKMPAQATYITAIVDAFIWTSFVAVEAAQYFGYVGILVLFVPVIGGILIYHRHQAAWERVTGAEEEEPELLEAAAVK